MSEHLTLERISELLDEPSGRAREPHLEVCARCEREFESMQRMRLTLSTLDEMEAPEGVWERVSGELPGPATLARPRRWRLGVPAAAAVLVFLGGLLLGLELPFSPSRPAASRDATTRTEGADASSVGSGSAGIQAAAHSAPPTALAELQQLRQQGPSASEAAKDPVAAARRLARLDALVQASREVLQEAPADPKLNDFLFQVVDERDATARQLDANVNQPVVAYH